MRYVTCLSAAPLMMMFTSPTNCCRLQDTWLDE
jgi:hypothetical protein